MPPWQCSHCGGLYGHGEAGTFRIDPGIKPFAPLFSWLEAVRFGYYAGNRTYVYMLCYPSGLPFYIGKGKGQRAVQHYKNAFSDKYKPKGEKERLIVDLNERNGECEWYHFLALCDDEGEAWQLEQHLINRWGIRSDSGMLCNSARGLNQGIRFDQEREPVIVPRWEAPDTIVTNMRERPREVYYPLEIRKRQMDPLQPCWCPSCSGECLVPDELMMIPVQCPFCAHFFRPRTGARMHGSLSFAQHPQMHAR